MRQNGGNHSRVTVVLAQKQLRALLDVGNFARAHAVAEEIVQAYVAAGQRVPTAMLAHMAEACLGRENWIAAEHWAQLALARGCSTKMVYVLAEAQLGQGAEDAAEATLGRLTAEQQATPATRRCLGEVQLAQGRYEAALATFNAILACEAQSAGMTGVHAAKVGRLIALQAIGPEEELEVANLDVIATAAAAAGPMDFDAVRLLTASLFENGFFVQVEAILSKLANRTDAEAYLRPSQRWMLAYAQGAQCNFGAAASNFRTYLAERPDDAAARTNLHWIEDRQRTSRLPLLETLAWTTDDAPLARDAYCTISMAPYEELADPVVLARGNGRYLFSYQQLKLWHDRVLKDFFEDRPFDGTQLFRVQPHVKSTWARAVDNGWISWWRPGA